MSCKATESLLALYVDDALTPVESQQIENHLATCSACSSLMAELREDRFRLRSLPIVLPPSGFREGLLRKTVLVAPRKQSVVRYLVPRLSSLAAALMVVLLASNLYLFPLVHSGQPVADQNERFGVMSAPPGAQPQAESDGILAGNMTPENEENLTQQDVQDDANNHAFGSGQKRMMITAAPAEAPEPDQPNYWLWSGLAGAGLFGLGTGLFVFRYHHN